MTTGVKSDVACHALLLPVIFKHVRYQNLLTTFEEKLGYCYKNRTLLQVRIKEDNEIVNSTVYCAFFLL